MIRLCTGPLPQADDPVAVQMACLYRAYGDCPGQASFYEQVIDGNTVAWFSLFAGRLNLVARPGVDPQEWRSFYTFLGQPTVWCTKETGDLLGLTGTQIWYWYVCDGICPACRPPMKEDTPRRVVCRLATSLCVEEIDSAVADLTRRYYRDAALMAETDHAAGVLLTNPHTAYLNGLVTLPEYRHKQEGSAVLHRLLRGAGARRVYACCDPDTAPFYEANGFVFRGIVICYGK